MGYTTEFDGEFAITPPLKLEHREYLAKFSETRRMLRDPTIAAEMADPLREAVGLPIGEHADYFVGGGGYAGQDRDASVVDYNTPAPKQPGLWCHWTPVETGVALVWDEGEKFYYYVPWLTYLIEHFFKPWGYTLNGEVLWQGEDSDDRGVIRVKDNEVRHAVTPLQIPHWDDME